MSVLISVKKYAHKYLLCLDFLSFYENSVLWSIKYSRLMTIFFKLKEKKKKHE